MFKIFLKLIILSLVFTSCSTQRFQYGTIKEGERASNYGNAHFFISGLGQTKIHDLKKICVNSGGIKGIETKQTFLNALISSITLGVYTPRTYKIYCNK